MRFILKQFYLISYFIIWIIVSSCIVQSEKKVYTFLTLEQKRVLELCSLVYTDPYYQYISPSRRSKIKKINTTYWGFWATFADGRTYRVPIQSGLKLGVDYYCHFRRENNYCMDLKDQESKCEFE